MKLESRIASYVDVTAIILDDEIYSRITDDLSPPKQEYNVPKSGYVAVGGYINDAVVSMYVVHNMHMHFMVLKKYRRYAGQLLDLARSLFPFPVYCEIPVIYKSVLNFAKKRGFKLVRVEKNAHLKSQKLYDVEVLSWDL